MKEGHTSVLLNEVIESLSLNPSDTVVDATLGGAGHFSQLLSALGSEGVLVGIDADPDATLRALEVVAQLDQVPVPRVVDAAIHELGNPRIAHVRLFRHTRPIAGRVLQKRLDFGDADGVSFSVDGGCFLGHALILSNSLLAVK